MVVNMNVVGTVGESGASRVKVMHMLRCSIYQGYVDVVEMHCHIIEYHIYMYLLILHILIVKVIILLGHVPS